MGSQIIWCSLNLSRYLGLPGSLQQLVESPASSSLLKRLLRRGTNTVPLPLPSPPLYYRYHHLLKARSHESIEILVIFFRNSLPPISLSRPQSAPYFPLANLAHQVKQFENYSLLQLTKCPSRSRAWQEVWSHFPATTPTWWTSPQPSLVQTTSVGPRQARWEEESSSTQNEFNPFPKVKSPALCLICGMMVCSQSACCETVINGWEHFFEVVKSYVEVLAVPWIVRVFAVIWHFLRLCKNLYVNL